MSRVSRRWWVALAVGIVAIGAQAVPYGPGRTNPPVVVEPQWDSPVTRELARRACYDCHSNETEWPTYSRIAPISWLVSHDVYDGRAALNFSEWQRPQEEAREAAEVVLDGEMPPRLYALMHAPARLTDAERANLARGLSATLSVTRSERDEREPNEAGR